MQEILGEIREKIEKYNSLINEKNTKNESQEIENIKEQIKNIKENIKEKELQLEKTSKVEKMKLTLNVIALESEITLKEKEIKEIKIKENNVYEENIRSKNQKIEGLKKDLQAFIDDSEKKGSVKFSVAKL